MLAAILALIGVILGLRLLVGVEAHILEWLPPGFDVPRLPAGVETLAVLLFDKLGVLGVFLGTLIVVSNDARRALDASGLLQAMVTAFAPLLSLRVLRSVLNLDNHLLNLSMQALVALVLVQGLLGTAGRAAVAGLVQGQTPQIADLLVGLTADVAGSMILILGVALVWRLQRHLRGGGGSSDV
ncbi:MAG: hypothetical protein EBS54_08135 [Betaproteobacteria bacterium]|nr:hypothetical protein [Betaproteobacteria bacterium]